MSLIYLNAYPAPVVLRWRARRFLMCVAAALGAGFLVGYTLRRGGVS